MSFEIYLPTRWVFGAGALDKLGGYAMPGKKAMLVISCGKSTRANGYLDRTQQQLERAGARSAVFDKVEANPLKSTVMDGAAFARENGCDFIVALGGGSVMDAAKAMAAMAANPGDLWDYVGGGTGKGLPLEKAPLPLVAITTTAGTGSEVDQYGVISNEETKEKIGFGGDDRLFPVLAVVDPELMTTVPPRFTAYQGFDALFHSTETYIHRAANPFSDMVALSAIEKVAAGLARAVRDGSDLEAREMVALGNTLSGYSMVTGSCTSEHSLEHAMSAFHHELPHGAGLIMISRAYYTHFINRHACDDRFVRMAKAMGMENATAPMDFITALTGLQEACGVADLKMSDYGMSPDEFTALARNAKDTMGGLFLSDPLPLSVEDCVEIYRASYK